MVQPSQGNVRRYMRVGSTVVGLVYYALSSSFNHLYGDWNSFTICAYIVSGSIICLAILFPKEWQHPRNFHHYRDYLRFLVSIFTTVYSFYLDRKSKTKPDAYALISSAAFATTSLYLSKEIECGFQDLMYFFCGLLVMQLMQIKPLLVFVGIGFSYFLVILIPHLAAPANRNPQPLPPNRRQTQVPQTVIEMASLLQSSALDARLQEEEEGSIQNQEAIATPVSTSAALRSESLRYRSSISRASSQRSRPSRSASRRSLDIHQNQVITRPAANITLPFLVIPRLINLSVLESLPDTYLDINLAITISATICRLKKLTRIDLKTWISSRIELCDTFTRNRTIKFLGGGDWIRKHRARFGELIERYQTSLWNQVLEPLELDTSSESLVAVKDILRLFNMHFKDVCTVHSKWIVSGRRLKDDLRKSLAKKLLPTYENFIHRFKNAHGEQASRYIEYEVPDIRAELGHLFGGIRGIDQPLREKGRKPKLE